MIRTTIFTSIYHIAHKHHQQHQDMGTMTWEFAIN